MDISARLKLIEARKRASSALIEDARSGLVPFVGVASSALPAPNPRRPDPPLRMLDGFREETGPLGTVLRREARIPEDGVRVHLPEAPVGPIEAGIARLMRPGESPPAPHEIVLLDTETTGLAGGAGTVAFIVGLAWRGTDGGVTLEQFLIRDFCDEAEMLRRVAERLSLYRAVAHYNGRSFDMPVLRSRAIIHRMRPPEFRMPEIDLLPPSRRLWRSHLGSASLKSVERGILGIDRGPDIDGAEIPAVFHEFARGAGHARMDAVAAHNAQDVVTMFGVLDLAAAIHGDPLGPAATRLSELEGMARFLAAAGDRAGAAALLDRAVLLTETRTDEERIRLAFAGALRRAGEHGRAAAQWRILLEASHGVALEAAVALAKLHEHAGRDPELALNVLRRHLRRLELDAEIESMLDRVGPATRRLEDASRDLHRRMERLAEKVRRRRDARPRP